PTTTATPSPLTGSTETPVSATLTGLDVNPGASVFYYRAVAVEAGGAVVAQTRYILPLGSTVPTVPPPAVGGLAASVDRAGDVFVAGTNEVAKAAATLNATVNPQGSATAVRFQYATDPTITPTVYTPYGNQAIGSDHASGLAVDGGGDVIFANPLNNA